MIKRRITVINKLGLHARAAARLIRAISGFSSRVYIEHPGKNAVANGRSILSVLALAAGKDTELELSVDGPDEAECIATMIDLFENKFGEDE